MIKVGRIQITSILETNASSVIKDCIEDATPRAINKISWLEPNYADSEGHLKASIQALVVNTTDKTVIVDTCVGNGRNRPGMSAWNNLQTDFLQRLSQACDPRAVDFVICTHLHFDHVGWNTTLVEDKWVPTFPNAKYLFCKSEFDYWKDRPENEVIDDQNGFEESVLPIYEAGLAKLVPSDFRLSDEISFIATPGHTPGHVSILLKAQGQQAIITGDVFHHPCQIAHPEWKTIDADSHQANETRHKLLKQFAGTDTLFIGSHFAEPISGNIKRSGDGYRFT